MGRPSGWKPYTLKDGTEIPSVTTIIGRFKESGGLIHWAWAEGKAGRDYRETRQAAADAGTLAHQMVEAHIRNVRWSPPPLVDSAILAKAEQAFDNFARWAEQTHLTPTDSERSLVSERYRFGGRLDAMLVDDQLSLGDWKASNALYPDYLIQLAAYGLLWDENYPDRPITGGYHLLRFSKESSDFTHHHFADLADAARAFLLMRELFDIDKGLKKRVR